MNSDNDACCCYPVEPTGELANDHAAGAQRKQVDRYTDGHVCSADRKGNSREV